jgi:hypothetical protein
VLESRHGRVAVVGNTLLGSKAALMVGLTKPRDERPPTKSAIQLYGNAPGKFMDLIRTLDELPETDAELKLAAGTALTVLRTWRSPLMTQCLLVQDGFVIAIEDLASHTFVWCGPTRRRRAGP